MHELRDVLLDAGKGRLTSQLQFRSWHSKIGLGGTRQADIDLVTLIVRLQVSGASAIMYYRMLLACTTGLSCLHLALSIGADALLASTRRVWTVDDDARAVRTDEGC